MYAYGCSLAIVSVFLWEIVDVLIFDSQFLEPIRWFGRAVFLISIGFILSNLVWLISLRKSSLSQYHACEHKIASMLEEGIDLTEENFSKTPCVLYRCGISIVLTFAVLIGIVGFFLSIENILISSVVQGLITYLIFVYTRVLSWILGILVRALANFTGVKDARRVAILRLVTVYLIEIPTAAISLVLVIPPVFGGLFALSKPSEEIMMEGLALAQRIQNPIEAPY